MTISEGNQNDLLFLHRLKQLAGTPWLSHRGWEKRLPAFSSWVIVAEGGAISVPKCPYLASFFPEAGLATNQLLV